MSALTEMQQKKAVIKGFSDNNLEVISIKAPIIIQNDDGGHTESEIEVRCGPGYLPAFIFEGKRFLMFGETFEAIACAVLRGVLVDIDQVAEFRRETKETEEG